MSKIWRAQDAGARFSEFLRAAVEEGPQFVSDGGKETAVLVPIEQWRTALEPKRRSLKELLLAPEARIESLTPVRTVTRHREPPKMD